MAGDETKGRLLAGRYRLLGSLGRGGMGVVWHARDEVLGREVAVKEILLPPELPDDEREILRQRTLREARSAARLSHPDVVTVYDVVEEDGRPWLVMELIRSRTLAEVVRESGPLPAARVAQIGLQVLAALETAHDAGVLHRDVKPSNVLLADDGRVVLTDFGIATLEGDPSLTRSGTLLGSPAYIAPERIQTRGAGPESDLWSLGATLYTAVEGRAPHDRGTALPTMTAAVTEAPDPAPLAGPLWPVLEGLLRKDPAARMDGPTARRLLQEAASAPTQQADSIARTLPSTPVPAASAPRGTVEQARDSGQQTRILPIPAVVPDAQAEAPVSPPEEQAWQDPAGAGSGGTGAAVAGSGFGGDGGAPASTGTSGRGRSSGKVLAAVVACVLVAGAVVGWAFFRPDGGNNAGRSPGTSATRPTAASSPTAPRSTSTASNPTSPPRTSLAVSSPPPSRQSSPTAGPSDAVPAGFRRHTDQTGFSLAVPSDWTVDRQGQRVYFREPGGSRFLLIDQTDQPKPDPVADWRQQEQARRDSYADYQRIRIEAVNYFQKAADWEFTYARGGGRQHVVNRGVVTSDHQAYGIYWSTPDSQWDASRQIFQTFTSSFRPAP
ncbi:hypothetical protein GCM10009744_16960 [Kribbella alba]|uniref:non-specific serine/threonine protein kinase n=1 Tax=Kribbella alba TaxID=190197 RepID=A0ABN2F589_9ACTN